MTFNERKKDRKERYLRDTYKRKMVPCVACNGSGCYDVMDSPPCGACNGTGKELGPKNNDENGETSLDLLKG